MQVTQCHLPFRFELVTRPYRVRGEAGGMVTLSPRIPYRLLEAIVRLDDRGEPIAETWRRVGAEADRLGPPAPATNAFGCSCTRRGVYAAARRPPISCGSRPRPSAGPTTLSAGCTSSGSGPWFRNGRRAGDRAFEEHVTRCYEVSAWIHRSARAVRPSELAGPLPVRVPARGSAPGRCAPGRTGPAERPRSRISVDPGSGGPRYEKRHEPPAANSFRIRRLTTIRCTSSGPS